MAQKDNYPQTLQQAMKYFADKDLALDFLVSLRWPNGVRCPHCDGAEHWFIRTRSIWRCKTCQRQFSARVGTILEDSALSLGKWFCTIWMVANTDHPVSSHQVHRSLGVTQKTAWFMLHRIYHAREGMRPP